MNLQQKKKPIIILVSIMLVLSLTCVFYNQINTWLIDVVANNFNIVIRRDSLMVHFISVGQGDAIAINLPDDKVMLIDTGPQDSSVTLTNYLNEKVLNTSRDDVIDYLILTHADADHIGGSLRVLQNFDVENIYMPVFENDSIQFNSLISYVEENDYNIIENLADIECFLDYSIDVFGPFEYTSSNDSCPVIKVTYMDKSFLFTGDISSTVEDELILEYGDEIDCDVLKVAHHGSKYSTSLEFLEMVTPEYAVISCGQNSYGHPTDVVINNIYDVGATLFRTDQQGNILFVESENYDLLMLNDNYMINDFILDYRFIILVIDVIIFVYLIILIVKNPKKRLKTGK